MITSWIIKLSHKCNVGCKHCYLGNLTNNKKRMEVNKFKIIISEIKKYYSRFKINLNNATNINIVVIDEFYFYKDTKYMNTIFSLLLNLRKELHNYNIKVIFQTSLQPLFSKSKEERYMFYEILNKYKIDIGTSWDFFDIRTYKGSAKNYENNLIKIIKENFNFTGKKMNRLYITLVKNMIGKETEIYSHLLKYQNFFEIILFFPCYTNSVNFKLNNFETSMLYSKFFELDYKNKILYFTNYYYNLFKSMKLESKLYDCYNNLISISPDGNISNCSLKQTENECYGNIFENSLDKILKSPQRLKDFNIVYKSLKVCKGCEFKNICPGICNQRKGEFLNLPEEEQTRENCPGYYPFLKFIKNKIL